MKKFYLSALFLGAFTFAIQAQVGQYEDVGQYVDFEFYSLDYISPQSILWKTWSGAEEGEEDAMVSALQARSGSNSLNIVRDGNGNDILYLIDDMPFDEVYYIRMYFYIPTGKEAYFNLQGEIFGNNQGNGSFLSGDHYFNPDNMTPGQGQNADGSFIWTFPHDQWFPVVLVVDLDTKTYSMDVDNNGGIPAGTPFNNLAVPYLGAIDFYAPSSFTNFFIDDIMIAPYLLNVNDVKLSSVKVFPNPMTDVLNISSNDIIDEVTIYDITGKIILSQTPNSVSPVINTSQFAKGVYLVKITIDGSSKVIKVMK